ncbi:putative MFS transporter, AGZA family, xanthine/uracil permease [Atopostipes suicloacalis DSM 15692]|uniref:Putative MFS transporter, AGZA family, xanthine/uracil permease n=1 Tax=Atopostipes suicloacalis DSM 15692 TaxID=1121025 RepID=A0A1M4Z9N6_9LACT|nr:NCS2 family permease [Atopostipes suicloacalis]SHF14724.1 putative MFS transporter, AGZA family, xanthine/uracil permease [Atopostipes suicloacalis DSM 15692]
MENFFKLKESNTGANTDVKTEVLAGVTSFMTMAYILAVNPIILSDAGMDAGGVFTATALSAAIATLVMALYANYPFGLASGMGLNAFFAYTVVLGDMQKSWQFALTAILIEGIIFIILSLFKVREAIFDSIPANLKNAVSVGIGLFIAFLGLDNAGIIQSGDGTLLGLGNLTAGTSLVALFGILITGFLFAKNVKGALLIGILVSTLIGIPLGVTELPSGINNIMSLPPSVSKVAFQFVGFDEIFSWDMLIVVFTFLFVDIFDTVGTLAGVAAKADMLDEDGKLPRVEKALTADAIGTIAGACLGTSTVTTFVESASGVAAGGRTGLTALSTAGMFVLSLFFAPLFILIPSAATAPALVIVGLFMMGSVGDIDFDDYTESIPAFLTIIMMPFSGSIAEGIVFGMISYVVLKGITGRYKEISWTMAIISMLFVLRIAFM